MTDRRADSYSHTFFSRATPSLIFSCDNAPYPRISMAGFPVVLLHSEMPHLVDFDAGRFRLSGQFFFAASSPVREDQMQPGIAAGYLESPVEGPQLPKQQIVFHAVLLSHLIQIPFKITVFDKIH